MNPLALFLLLSNDRKTDPTRGAASAAPTPRAATSARNLVRVSTAAATKKNAKHALHHPAPWPASPPAWLPKFPLNWVPFEKAPAEVIARAGQLIKQLHSQGLGRTQLEHIAGQWVTFVSRMHGTKKAVEAYKVKPSYQPYRANPEEPTPKTSPRAVPTAVKTTPAGAARPMLKLGDGMGARAALAPHVAELQALLNAHGASLSADGKFGPLTHGAVRQYQSAYGLQVDGIVGPKTWGSLLSATANA